MNKSGCHSCIIWRNDEPDWSGNSIRAILRELVEAHRRMLAPACVPVFQGQRGNPALFDRALFPELQRIRGDTGASELLERCADSIAAVPAGRAVMVDIDTPEDHLGMTNDGADDLPHSRCIPSMPSFVIRNSKNTHRLEDD